MKKLSLSFLVLMVYISAFSQDWKKNYLQFKAEGNNVAIDSLLKMWEQATPDNPDLIIAYFNYWADRSRLEVLASKNDTASFYITTADTSSMNMVYDTTILNKGLEYINRGIKKYPKRLDMRFGKIYMLGEAKLYKAFTDELLDAIDYGNSINYEWQWEDTNLIDDSKNNFLNSVQRYLGALYTTGDDHLLPYMREVSQRLLKYNPDDVTSLSNIALTYAIVNNYDEAIKYLLLAEKKQPNNVFVLSNLAEMYMRKNDTTLATSYYHKMMTYGNEEDRKYAEQKLQSIK